MGKHRRSTWGRLLWGLFGVAAVLAVTYLYVTDPQRLRSAALQAAEEAGLHGFDVGHVSFSPWGGLEMREVVLAAPASADRDRPVVYVRQAQLDCELSALLRGELRLRRVTVGQAALRIVFDPPAHTAAPLASALDARMQDVWSVLHEWERRLPPIDIAQADVSLLITDHGKPRLLERSLLRAIGEPTERGYSVHVLRLPAAGEPLLELGWETKTGDISLALDWMPVATLRRLLPGSVREVLDRSRLTGMIRLHRVVFSRPEPTPADSDVTEPTGWLSAADIELEHASAVLPIEADVPARDAYLQLNQSGVRLTFNQGEAAGQQKLIARVHGKLNGAPLAIEAVVQRAAMADGERSRRWGWDDILTAEMRIDGLRLPTLNAQPDFVLSPNLPGPVRAALKDYRPDGEVDMRFRVLAPELGLKGAERLEGEVYTAGATASYFQFPYEFTDVRGEVRLSRGQVLFDGLTARHGPGVVRVEGSLNNTKSYTGFGLVFHGWNIPLSQELYAALPPEHRKLWEAGAPLGLVDAVVTVERPEGSVEAGAQPTEVEVEARMVGGSIALADDQRLHNADGHFSVQGQRVRLHDLHGYDAGASIHQRGDIWVNQGGVPQADVRVQAANVWVEEEARLEAGESGPARTIRFAGLADVWGRVYGTDDAARQQNHYAVHLRDGEVQALKPQKRWTHATGWVVVRNDDRRLLSFHCQQPGARIQAAGELPAGALMSTPLSLDVHASGVALEDLIPQWVPPDWLDLATAVGLEGAGDVALELRPAEGNTTEQMASIEVRSGRMQAAAMPLPLQDVSARLELTPGTFRLRDGEARWGTEGKISAGGEGRWDQDGLAVDLSVTAKGMRFCPEINAAMPTAVTSLLEKLAASGEFDVLLHRVQFSGPPEARAWQLAGHLPLRDTSLELGLALTGAEGELAGTCAIGPSGEVTLEAQFDLLRGQLAGRPVSRWHGVLTRSPQDRWVRLDDLQGQLCGGEGRGSVWIDPDSGDYEVSLTLKDVALNELFPPPADEQPTTETDTPSSALIDGHVHVRGQGRDPSTRRGGGELRLRGMSFMQTPVLASVSAAEQGEAQAASDRVGQAEIRFLWEGSLIRLQRIDINSRDLRLIGDGMWDLRTDALQMTLFGAHPEHWPRLMMITDLLESAGQELVQYHVTGTLRQPTVKTEPLYKLNAALRALLEGSEN